ncbi:MAG: hypothetical protein ACO1Q7_10520, partial [Gemmatimonas sp.]
GGFPHCEGSGVSHELQQFVVVEAPSGWKRTATTGRPETTGQLPETTGTANWSLTLQHLVQVFGERSYSFINCFSGIFRELSGSFR